MDRIEDDLGPVNQPLPMRGDREDQLLATLLEELSTGPFNTDRDVDAFEFEHLSVLEQGGPSRWRRRAAWYLATAAAVAILAMTATTLIGRQATDTAQLSTDPAAEAIDSACRAFAADAPSLQVLADQLSHNPPDTSGLEQYQAAFESLIAALDDLSVTDVPVQTRRQLLVIDGYLHQAHLAATQGGPPPVATMQSLQGDLDRIADRDQRFQSCST